MTDPTNNDRAFWANCALEAHMEESGSDDAGLAFQDLLCDLRHLADARGLPFQAALDRSASHYAEEITEGPKATTAYERN
jgi:hypothetical protein